MLSTIKSTYFLSSLLERPLCCLAFITLIHCSVFKVQSPAFTKTRNKYSILFEYLFPSLLRLVGPSGLEPPTLRLSVVRSSQLSYGPVRRHKLHIPRRTVYSTSRSFRCVSSSSQTRFAGLCSDFGRLAIILFFLAPRKSVCFCGMVEIVGIEPATSCLQGRRSPS